MDVEDAGGREVEDRRRDDLAVVGEDAELGLERGDRRDRLGVPQTLRLEGGARPSSRAPARPVSGLSSAFRPAGWSGRGDDAVTSSTSGRVRERLEDRDGERPGAEEDGRDRPGHASAVARCSASSSSPADRDELVHRVEVVDVQLAVEVVELVLERPAEQPGPGDLDLPPEPVLGDHPDPLAAGDVGDVAGDRQAAPRGRDRRRSSGRWPG